MRTGLVGDVAPSDAENDATNEVLALMRVFMKDALTVSGRYAVGCGRTSVTGDDMRRALMYCARTFFERSDAQLAHEVQCERVEMDEESDQESDEESDQESDQDQKSEGAEEATASPADLQLVRNVDAVASVWHLWCPDDPVHCLIKRAIDNTPVS